MSDNSIKQILDKLEKQNQLYLQTVSEHKEAVSQLQKTVDEMVMEVGTLQSQLAPINELFNSVTGFNRIAVWAMKGILLFGAFIGLIYGFFVWVRN